MLNSIRQVCSGLAKLVSLSQRQCSHPQFRYQRPAKKNLLHRPDFSTATILSLPCDFRGGPPQCIPFSEPTYFEKGCRRRENPSLPCMKLKYCESNGSLSRCKVFFDPKMTSLLLTHMKERFISRQSLMKVTDQEYWGNTVFKFRAYTSSITKRSKKQL